MTPFRSSRRAAIWLVAAAIPGVIFLAGCGERKGPEREPSRRDSLQQRLSRQVFDIESGKVEMEITTPTPTGNLTRPVTLYFDSFGRRQALYTPADSARGELARVVITSADTTVAYFPETRVGNRYRSSERPADILAMISGIREGGGGSYRYRDLGEREIAAHRARGFSADTTGMHAEIWQWNGIPMAVDITAGGGRLVMEVIRLDTLSPVTQERFDVPSDVRIVDAPPPGAPPMPARDSVPDSLPVTAPPPDSPRFERDSFRTIPSPGPGR